MFCACSAHTAVTNDYDDMNCINSLKPKLVQIIFTDSVRTAKKTQHFTIKKINWLTLFKEIIAVYTENHTKDTNNKADLLIVKAVGIYSYHYFEGLNWLIFVSLGARILAG
jgi:hypothetical protein